MASTKSFSGQDIADAIGVEGITLRRYIRSDGTRVGRGKKYSFSADEARSIVQGFAKLSDVTLPDYDEDTNSYVDEDGNEVELTDDQKKLIEVNSLFVTPEAEEAEDTDDETEDPQEDDTTEDSADEDLSDLDDNEDEDSDTDE